jgi:hypothetical protein
MFLLFQVAPPLPIFGSMAQWIPLLGLPAPLIMFWVTSRVQPGWGLASRTREFVVAAILVFHFVFQGGLYGIGVANARADLASAAALARTFPENAIVTGRVGATLALMAPVRGVSVYTFVSRPYLEELAKAGPVWLFVLEGDEKLVDEHVWACTRRVSTFPVGYSQTVRYLTAYRYESE